MKAFKDWISSQAVSKSLLSSRPLLGGGSIFEEEAINENNEIQGSTATGLQEQPVPGNNMLQSSIDNEESRHASADDFRLSGNMDGIRMDPLAKIESLQIKFMRLVHRLGQSHDNILVAKVLYRLHLATLIRVGEKTSLRNDRARAMAAELEAAGHPDFNFSLRILVMGKTGVGKSATINSIFDQVKAATDAFQPATNHIREVIGTSKGIKLTFIDTPGLLPSSTRNVRRNRKILRSVKDFIRKTPPDIVLYFERLDHINMGYSDFPLLKLITDTFGSAIWLNTILVMTHSSGALPEGPNGYPVSYEPFVAQCTNLVQHYIHQAVSDLKIENPVLMVENHPQCKKNMSGEKVLPNGQAWRSQFLLLCICMKVLVDANTLLKFRDGFQIGPSASNRLPSLPHLLSTLLRPRSTERENDELDDQDTDDEDEYDQLPPIHILSKAQFEKLTKSQKNAYLDELDYRETLYLKKQFKTDIQKRRNSLLPKDGNSANDEDYDNHEGNPEAVQLPDIAVPPSFDSNWPVHRYRCVVTNDQWLARPVLDPQGWDHDVGFDGINLETVVEMKKNLHLSVLGQLSKDKQDFSIQTECNALFTDLKGSSVSASLDVQTAGKDLVCTVRGDTKLRNLKHNTTGCGVSVTSFGNKYFVGGKIEDTISVGKRVKLDLSAGRMGGLGQVAYGGSFETTVRGRDYPVRNEKISLTMTVLSFDKEMVFGGNILSDFRISHSSKLSLNANLNSRRMGQICVKTSSSDRIEIGLIAVISIIRAIFRRRAIEDRSGD
ncbi:translocase of chloroplast 90 protein [Thalictrum thalictroides]|uniref:Translocase of chloroplast 90 protein n=1 Tax=Thalictrum thalictroides TaxID=46969 RepID=A0A7J6W361_THATH|nr:translocase of chloroplast 90 protein [Thalictrum thalictroides]